MRKTIAATLLLLSVGAQASTTLEAQVLESMVANSASIQLVDEESTPLPKDQQLPAIISRALTENYMNLDAKKGGLLSSTTIQCKNTTPAGLVGSSSYKCQVVIGNGTFSAKGLKKGLSPETESAYVIELEVSRVVVPGAKPVIKSPAKTFIAG